MNEAQNIYLDLNDVVTGYNKGQFVISLRAILGEGSNIVILGDNPIRKLLMDSILAEAESVNDKKVLVYPESKQTENMNELCVSADIDCSEVLQDILKLTQESSDLQVILSCYLNINDFIDYAKSNTALAVQDCNCLERNKVLQNCMKYIVDITVDYEGLRKYTLCKTVIRNNNLILEEVLSTSEY